MELDSRVRAVAIEVNEVLKSFRETKVLGKW